MLKYNVDLGSFLNSRDYYAAKDALAQVAAAWNALGLGIIVKAVKDYEPAVFELAYRQDEPNGDGNSYTSAFFPGAPAELRKILVFAKSFEPDHVDSLTNIFCHEIGHILGLRHEFAEESARERSVRSVQFGPRNRLSVMNRFEHPRMINLHPLDVVWVQSFYAYNEPYYHGVPVVDVDVSPGTGRRSVN